MRRPLTAVAVLLSLPLFSLAADPLAPVVSKLAVERVNEDTEDVSPMLMSGHGTRFVLIVSQPGRKILGINESACKLTSAKDDKGTNLTSNKSWISSFFSKTSADGEKIGIPITLGKLPAAGATSIQFQAEIVLDCGADEKTEEIKPFDLSKGTSVKYGKHTLEVKPLKQGSEEVSLSFNDGGTWLKSIEFIDESGKTIKSDSRGSMRMNQMLTRDYNLEQMPKAVGIRLTRYQKVEQVTQKVDVKVTLGL